MSDKTEATAMTVPLVLNSPAKTSCGDEGSGNTVRQRNKSSTKKSSNDSNNNLLLKAGKQKEAERKARAELRKKCRDKEFTVRPSLLTELLHNQEYACLYNIFMAIVINLSVYVLVKDVYSNGRISLGISNIYAMFDKPLATLSLLVGMHAWVLGVYYAGFRMWSDNRFSFLMSSIESIWDLSFVMMLGLFVYGFYYAPIVFQFSYGLPLASGAIVVLEQLRLTMKMYAFLRSNVPKVMRANDQLFVTSGGAEKLKASLKNPIINCVIYEDDELLHFDDETEEAGTNGREPKSSTGPLPLLEVEDSPAPSFSTFAYFVYAPTLIYRDSYPRTDKIRWGFIFRTVVELLGCIYMYNLVHHLCGFTMIDNFGKPGVLFGIADLLPYVFAQCIVGILGCVLGFYVLLHASQNIVAELLRFGDRQFYRDWWNSDSFGSYYRKWNVIVHDFLYTYIYKEAVEAQLYTVHKYLPAVLVFLVSSLFHEYIFIYVLQFFYPVLLVFFGGIGMILCFIPNKSSWQMGNLFVWWSLLTGCGLIHAFYTLEYFARKNGCPPAATPLMDFMVPRSWTCGAISV